MENWHGLVWMPKPTGPQATPEREATLTLGKRNLKAGGTLDAVKGYYTQAFVSGYEGSGISQWVRKRIEQVYG